MTPKVAVRKTNAPSANSTMAAPLSPCLSVVSTSHLSRLRSRLRNQLEGDVVIKRIVVLGLTAILSDASLLPMNAPGSKIGW